MEFILMTVIIALMLAVAVMMMMINKEMELNRNAFDEITRKLAEREYAEDKAISELDEILRFRK